MLVNCVIVRKKEQITPKKPNYSVKLFVKGISAPLNNDFWYRYQKQDYREATRIALEASLDDVPLVSRFMLIAIHYSFC